MASQQEGVVPLDANKAVVRRLFDEVINQGKLEVVDDLFGPQHVHHFPHRDYHGPQGARELFAGIRQTFPVCHMAIDDMIAEGEMVAVRFTARVTHGATGKRATYEGADFFRLADGKIVERHGLVDMQSLQQQLSDGSASA
jgi:predicted SnoaL-like aldol condensation-catalyzing enzyme